MEQEELKRCTKCNQDKELQLFPRWRKHRLKGLTTKITTRIIDKIYHDFNNRCAICDSPVLRHCKTMLPNKGTIDHIIPVSKGGTNDINNLQLLCNLCNQKKCAKIDYMEGVSKSRQSHISHTAGQPKFSVRNVLKLN